MTNPEAVAWFVHRLKRLQAATGIDGFKFDAGARTRVCLCVWRCVCVCRVLCAIDGFKV